LPIQTVLFQKSDQPVNTRIHSYLRKTAIQSCINLVDTAMYLAKAHGRNRAYGVRLLHAQDEGRLDEITRALEDAWREGRVTLTLLQGPVPMEAAA